ncbi:MAG TPA: YhfC family glutamic-type intramembrane protease [Symbiobacteriaceae bacterium]|nr:YhfC family glutamic-type intramembrane protease [Symbiobacteriaceae bacterium]
MTPDETLTETQQRPELPKHSLRDFLIAVPLMLAVGVAYLFASHIWGEAPRWGLIGLGALGWWAALILRFPFIPLAKKMGDLERQGSFMAFLAGVCEESVRLGWVLLFGRSFTEALALGIGWGAIEVLFAIINGGVRIVLLSRDDEKARQALAMLAEQGQLKETPGGWFVGAWERFFASALHLGFTLLVAWQPWLVVLLLPAHGLVDLAIPKFMKRSVWLVEGIVTVVGAAALLLGLTAFGQI